MEKTRRKIKTGMKLRDIYISYSGPGTRLVNVLGEGLSKRVLSADPITPQAEKICQEQKKYPQ
jgi:hypothetical protein